MGSAFAQSSDVICRPVPRESTPSEGPLRSVSGRSSLRISANLTPARVPHASDSGAAPTFFDHQLHNAI